MNFKHKLNIKQTLMNQVTILVKRNKLLKYFKDEQQFYSLQRANLCIRNKNKNIST